MVRGTGVFLKNFSVQRVFQNSKFISPHHGLDGLGCTLVIFGRSLACIINVHFTLHQEVNQLADRHARINADRLRNRDFQSPMVAKPDVPLSRRRMDVNAQPADTRLPSRKGT